MRAAAFLPLLLLLPGVAAGAPVTYEATYTSLAQGCGSGALQRCKTYFPTRDLSSVTAVATDVSGEAVRIRICHEWTYDDGSHPTVWCDAGCGALSSTLAHPGARTTYRALVDLRSAGCDAPATAGTLRVSSS